MTRRIRALGPVVCVKWTHTQQSRIVRPDRYRQSGTDNADAMLDPRQWRGLDNLDRLTLVEVNRQYHLWLPPWSWAVAINTDDKGKCHLTHAELRDESLKVRESLEKLRRLGLVDRSRAGEYRAVVVSEGFDVGRVVAVGDPNPGLEPGEYVLFDSGTAISMGWPATEEEIDAGEDGSQAGWAPHVLAWILDDAYDEPTDPSPGFERCRNFFFFVPADRVAASLGFDPPGPGEIG